MLLFHAVFASAAAATSASPFFCLLGHVWLREVDISVPPKRYITLLCLFGNIVDIIILGYNYHLFSSADFFF